MGIRDKATYGDYYWASQVEAAKFFDEEIENTFASYFSGMLADIPNIDALPTNTQRFIKVLSDPPTAGFGGFALGVGVEMIDEVLHTAMAPMMKIVGRELNKRSRETWLTPEQANILFSRGHIDKTFWNTILASEGYEDVLQRFHYMSQIPYPSIPDLVVYSRYHGDPDNPWGEIQEWFDIPARDWPVWKWLGIQRLTTMQVQTLFRRGLISEESLLNEFAKIGWSPSDRLLLKELGWTIPNAMLLVQGDLQQGVGTDEILKDISIADINPAYAQTYLDAILTKPSSQDVIAYQLRIDPKLSGLDERLRKIGIHPEWREVYKELAYVIPPVADIITMAVREAFTPEIAARFGQYEDYPKDLEEWGIKKGLSAEWSQRYWAAHWSLPSAQQGFEMLHRGVIDQDDLNMLLRALDIMPFWRERLTRIAYRRLSRVDIRRMYRVGVLTEKEVYEAYLELGYNERDAKRMSDFTVKQTLATQAKFTSRDVITAYSKYMISRSETRSLLIEVGVKEENISYILSTADYKREWALTESKITAIRNLFRQEVYTVDKTRDELLKLDLPAERVNVIMEQWYVEDKDKPPRYWTTAQTLGFIKEGLITKGRGEQELRNLGYDVEHISVYMRTIG